MRNEPDIATPCARAAGLHLAHHAGMPSACRRALILAGAWLLMLVAAPARAEDPRSPVPHVRPEKSARALFAAAVDRSQTVRELVDRLDQSNVIVYIRTRVFGVTQLDGRIGFLAASPPHRYLVIELACGRPLFEVMATLGHELRHAVEIADAPSIVDVQSMAAHYERIGFLTSGANPVRTFETDAAVEAGRRAHRELLGTVMRSAHGT